MDDNLFELPFNLAGESQSNELTAEAEARVRALADSEARKAQADLFAHVKSAELRHEQFRKSQRDKYGLSA